MDSVISRIIVFVSFIAAVWCQDEPEITQIILPDIRRSGETGRLNCSITRQGQNQMHWIHAVDEMVISNDDKIALDDNVNTIVDGYQKYDVLKFHNEQVVIYQLLVRRLQSEDAGIYICQVQISSTENRIVEQTGRIIVMVPPTIIHAKTTQSLTVSVGDDVDLTCDADAYPEPVIKWVRPNGKSLPLPGAPFSISNDTLPLRNLKKDDRGVYRCIADNNVPPAGLYDATVYIQFPPYARAVQTSYGQAQSRQFDVTLECRIEGNPEPNLQWFQREGETGLIAITNDDRHLVHILISHGQELSISEFWFQLTIINVLGNDYGDFICRGSNDLGTHEATVLLYETSECQGPNCPAESQPSSASTYSAAGLLLSTLLLVHWKL